MTSFQQMPLALKAPRRPSFNNFIPGQNDTLLATLRFGLDGDGWFVLLGAQGSGKSHLLTAVFDAMLATHRAPVFLPLADQRRWPLLDELVAPTIVVDDIDALAGHDVGEMALFNALNRWRAERSTVIMGTRTLGHFQLPDLGSRLGQATRLTLKPLDEQGLQAMVAGLVADQDMSIASEVAQYLVMRSTRNASELTQLTQALMQQALGERRAITKPMVRALLASQ